MSSHIELTIDGAIAQILINRPDKRNALNIEMMRALESALDTVESTDGLRVLLIRGAGGGFSAGIDLMGFQSMAEHFGEHWRDNLFPMTAAMQHTFNKLERLSIPVIAVLHGYCLGMGLELALACDFRIAAEGTVLALPETKLGLIPDVGGTTRLTRLLGVARAKEYIMTGRAFDPHDAERWGLLNALVPADQLDSKARAFADELCAAAPLAVSYAKRVIDQISDIERGLHAEAWAQSVLIRSEDFAQGVQAMLTKSKPEWQGK